MSFSNHLALCHYWPAEQFRPFKIAGRLQGWMTHNFAEGLAAYPDVFDVGDREVLLSSGLATPEARSTAVEGLLDDIIARGLGPRRRGETYPVNRAWEEPPAMLLDRGAVPYFGTRSYGVHVNGFVRRADGIHLWVGRRNANKPVAPGKLDHMVAGGQPHGLSLEENLIKEAWEEASLEESVAARAEPVARIAYRCLLNDHVRDDVLFCYDLELPEEVTPRPQDDEVESFELWPLAEVLARVRDSDDFKFNVNLVLMDFFLRHGALDPKDPEIAALARRLYSSPED